MSNEHSQADLDEVSSRLSEGLKSCRTVVANYRVMLGTGANDNTADERQSPDNERTERA